MSHYPANLDQLVLTEPDARMGDRCDRTTLDRIEARMRGESVESGSWRGMPAIVEPLVWGTAVA